MDRYKKFFSEIKMLSANSGRLTLALMLSFIICRFLHGASWDNFRVLEMYRLNNEERKRVYTFQRQKKISDALNKNASNADLRTLMEKNKFNSVFKDYIHRDWYDSTKPDIKQFKLFLQRNDKFLLKPVLSSKGKGIELLYSAELDTDAFFEYISSRKVILEGFIEQHVDLASINPSSVNTIRLITARIRDNVHVIHGGVSAVVARMPL